MSPALREGKTDRSIRITPSLAFLAPDIVKAAVEGRLPGPSQLVINWFVVQRRTALPGC